MNKYNKSKIYKIVCNITNQVYYGSSTEQYITSRIAKHKYANKNLGHHSSSSIVMENNNYSVIIVEECNVENKFELLQRERYYIENNECVNKNVPNKTQLERLKEWRKKNEYAINCECGKEVKKSELSRHIKSKYHTNFNLTHSN
jgi:hypothetical protein